MNGSTISINGSSTPRWALTFHLGDLETRRVLLATRFDRFAGSLIMTIDDLWWSIALPGEHETRRGRASPLRFHRVSVKGSFIRRWKRRAAFKIHVSSLRTNGAADKEQIRSYMHIKKTKTKKLQNYTYNYIFSRKIIIVQSAFFTRIARSIIFFLYIFLSIYILSRNSTFPFNIFFFLSNIRLFNIF